MPDDEAAPTGHARTMSATPPPLDDHATSYWEVRVGVYCTERRALEIQEAVGLLLCPEPDHDGPCEVPWSTSYGPMSDDDGLRPTLAEQVRHEQG